MSMNLTEMTEDKALAKFFSLSKHQKLLQGLCYDLIHETNSKYRNKTLEKIIHVCKEMENFNGV